jgi:hypothetical protein
MRRILLSGAILAVLALPGATTARAAGHGQPGFLVVRKGTGDGGVNGHPVVTLVIQGFVLGRVSQDSQVDIFQLPSRTGQGGPQEKGADVTTRPIKWRRLTGTEYRGSNFRFSAMGGNYRVVVRGSGLYLFAGGYDGNVRLRGSSVYRNGDGWYSLDGGPFLSLPTQLLKRTIGRG